MNRLALIVLLALFPFCALPQEQDTVSEMRIRLDQVVVTATKTNRRVSDIPAQVQTITGKDIQAFPANNIDDLLKSSANINVNRSWGIFSKNSSVTMRGLPGSGRALILVDGVPKNKIAGGSVNWHNINPDHIERIEIIKGPASALYGNNAMGGVINIITKRPVKRLEGSAQVFGGTFNTGGASLDLGGSELIRGRGVYWNLNAYGRKGDGYYLDPPEFMDKTDVRTYLREHGGGALVGYRFNASGSLEVLCDYYQEIRGAGLKIYEDQGSYESTRTSDVVSKFSGKTGHGDLLALVYLTSEDFFGQKESLNEFNEYRLLDSYTSKQDKGLWVSWSGDILKYHRLTIGTELKMGDVAGRDIYRTSTDLIEFNSKMAVSGTFIQDEINFPDNRFKMIAGLRYDRVSFFDGFQAISEPTSVTGFPAAFSENFKANRWNAVSPKIALHYSFSKKAGMYLSAGSGYVPPDLKDLSQTGRIRKGFRLANPDLRPETLTNYEIGYSHCQGSWCKLNAAVYYSDGRDFQYMVGTGDSIDTGGTLKPVLRAENVARIRIAGLELSSILYPVAGVTVNLGYSYNNSTIVDFNSSEIKPDKDLTGKDMIEVSPNQLFAGLNWSNRYFTLNLNCNYVDNQWYDDENTILVDDYFISNFRLAKTFKKHYRIYFDVQNIFDADYIDRKGQLSPGRFMTAGFQYII